jgi:peptidoglycan hydrolase-like protein with peptidoglycan-binding domain
MRIGLKIAATLLATAGTAVSLVATGGTAHAAATPNCTTVKSQYVGNGWYLNSPAYNATSGSHFSCYLELGDRNSAVTWLQKTIQYCYDDGEIVVDGVYGTQTRAKVRIVQAQHHVAVTGIYGRITRSAMYWRLYNPSLHRWSEQCYSPV